MDFMPSILLLQVVNKKIVRAGSSYPGRSSGELITPK
jgi:hypothetical protein